MGKKQYGSELLNEISYLPPESLGAPVTATQILGNETGVNEKGEAIFYGVTSGPPALFFVYNLDTETVEDVHPLEDSKTGLAAKCCYCVNRDGDGVITLVTQSACIAFRYDPKTKKLRCYGPIAGETAVMTPGYVDEEGDVYFGTYPRAKLFRYSKRRDRFEDLGIIIPKGQYARAVVGFGDSVYAGGISNPSAQFVKYSISTGEKRLIPNPSLPGQFSSEQCNTFYSATGDGKYLFARCKFTGEKESVYALCVFDMVEEKWIDVLPCEPAWMHTTGILNGRIYFHTGSVGEEKRLMAYSPVSGTLEDTGIRLKNHMCCPRFVRLRNQKEYPGFTIVAGADTDGILLFNPETQKLRYRKKELPRQSMVIRTLKPGRGDDLILSAYMGSEVFFYDRRRQQVRDTAPCTQIEGIGVFDGKYYFGMYDQAQLFEFDPEQPGKKGENPRPLAFLDSKVKQNRAFCVIKAEDKIVWGSVPHYGCHGGAVGIYDTKTGKTVTCDIPQQSVSGIAYQNQRVYVSTNIYGGLGDCCPDQPACVLCIDLKTGKIIAIQEISFKTDLNRQYFLGGLTFSRDGRLFVAGVKTLAELCPDTLEVLKELPVGQGKMTLEEFRWLPFALEWLPSGLLLTNIGEQISAVDVDTFEVKQVLQVHTYGMTVDENSAIYYINIDGQTELLTSLPVFDKECKPEH